MGSEVVWDRGRGGMVVGGGGGRGAAWGVGITVFPAHEVDALPRGHRGINLGRKMMILTDKF